MRQALAKLAARENDAKLDGALLSCVSECVCVCVCVACAFACVALVPSSLSLSLSCYRATFSTYPDLVHTLDASINGVLSRFMDGVVIEFSVLFFCYFSFIWTQNLSTG